ncbi:MAG: hypothetical protein CVU38_12690 [Chloroflexi bacterium HGW-Chloroflexi-1]|nr:MAG: hypothetical protein CVU38_12690 [Chloroflexi bacterium HGW-Chloroflexi-1]
MLAFGVTLALIVGQRMSTDAMAVVIGVAVGVAASVPTSLLLVALLRRERRDYRADPPPQAYPQLQQPNVIVLNPADLLGGRKDQPYVPLPPPELSLDGGMRRLRVVGDDEEWAAGEW